MNIKIHSSELNRMMKTIGQCIDQRDISSKANIEITYDNNLLSISASNGIFSGVMSTPVLGGDGENFCVDGAMFAKVCAMCSGEVTIVTDEKVCTIKGFGRTKLPIVNAKLPAFEKITGKTVNVSGENFSGCFGHVAYAIATDQSRPQLTGVLVETDGNAMKMVALDGFQMSVDETVCEGDAVKMIVPGAFMKLVSASVGSGEDMKITTDGHSVQAETDGMLLKCGLLAGEYVDYNRILPKDFTTQSKVNVETVKNMLKAGNVVNNKQNLVKLDVAEDRITIRNNSEQAEFEAEVPCVTQGNSLKIAFNDKYLMNTMTAVDEEDAVMNFNTSTSPVVVKSMDGKGVRLVLPVRVM